GPGTPNSLGCFSCPKESFLSKEIGRSTPTDSIFLREGFEPFSGEITTSKVVKVETISFSGHVYNLETSYGYYTAEGILVGNCLPPKNKQGQPYPTGAERSQAEHCCRHWDRVQRFDTRMVEVSLHPAGILREVTPLPLL